jgi:hypothetical protein
MFELIPIIMGIAASIITASQDLHTLLKGPHITFSLKKADFCLNREHEERISLPLAPVANKRQRFLVKRRKRRQH